MKIWLEMLAGENFGFAILLAVTVSCGLIEAMLPAVMSPPRRLDRWPANVALSLTNVIVSSLVPVSTLLAAETARSEKIGLFNIVDLPTWGVNSASFFIFSFVIYVQHVVSHKVPALWRLHRVHHIDTHLDVSTSGRHHPLELVFGIVFSLPFIFVLGLAPDAILAYLLLAVVTSTISHANVRLPRRIDTILQGLFVTPNMHSIHHSASQRETDSNYGDVFSVWDRLFRTHKTASAEHRLKMLVGLKEVQDDRADDLWWQLWSPFVRDLKSKT